MAKRQPKKTTKPRTGHRLVINADNPVPSPTHSRSAAVVTADNPTPAPNQSAPSASVVDQDAPVPAPAAKASTTEVDGS